MQELLKNEAIKNIDQLLASSLDDLDDLPSFEVPANGTYIVNVTTTIKEINKEQAVEAAYEVIEVVELADPADTPPVPGTKFSQLYTLNPIGIGKLKEFCKPFAAHFNTPSIGELVKEHIQDVRVAANVKRRPDKTDPEKVYASVKIISVA